MEQVTISLEESLKVEVEESLNQLGITWSECFHQSLLQYIPNSETIEAIKRIEAGEDVGKTYNNMDEFWLELGEENANT